jgi:hypothetical protein
MPSLLSLPREIRDEIIDYVVHSSRPAPAKPARDVPPADAGRVEFDDVGLWPGFSDIRYNNLAQFESLPDAFEPPCSSLLRTCHQLRAETLERQAKVQVPCVLDMLIVNGKDLYLTWLSIPLQRSPIIEHLKINVRVSGAWRHPCYRRKSTLNPHYFSCLTQRLPTRIISRVTSGPIPEEPRGGVFTSTDDNRFLGTEGEFFYTPHYCIRKLDVIFDDNVLKDADEVVGPPDRDFEYGHPRRRRKNDPIYIQHPDQYRYKLEYVLRTTFFGGRGIPVYGSHRRVLRERVGGVTISGHGVVQKDWSGLSGTYEDLAYVKIGPWSEDIKKVIDARKRNGIH